jgi:serine-type D-Ala-D-Ala carboxypeptidase
VSIDDARRVVEEARGDGVFPAAAVDVGSNAGSQWSEAFGTGLLTPFDLASLTKVIATTTVMMDLSQRGMVALDARVAEFFVEWRGTDRDQVTVRDLLEHASGLPARLLDAPPVGRREFEHEICATPLEYRPRSQSTPNALWFILLGFLAADRGAAPLDQLFDEIMIRLKPDTNEDGDADRTRQDSGSVRPQADRDPGGRPELPTFNLPADVRGLAAPTQPMNEDSRRGRALVGEVHDNYAAALGGVAGHAGLFATASGVGAFARVMLRALLGDAGVPPPFSPDHVREFVAKSTVAGSSRALGWDTMLPTSSCGTRMSTEAFGHVGYTGTSLWIDPGRDRYFVLLTNRVFGGGTLDQMRRVRRAFHDALGDV